MRAVNSLCFICESCSISLEKLLCSFVVLLASFLHWFPKILVVLVLGDRSPFLLASVRGLRFSPVSRSPGSGLGLHRHRFWNFLFSLVRVVWECGIWNPQCCSARLCLGRRIPSLSAVASPADSFDFSVRFSICQVSFDSCRGSLAWASVAVPRSVSQFAAPDLIPLLENSWWVLGSWTTLPRCRFSVVLLLVWSVRSPPRRIWSFPWQIPGPLVFRFFAPLRFSRRLISSRLVLAAGSATRFCRRLHRSSCGILPLIFGLHQVSCRSCCRWLSSRANEQGPSFSQIRVFLLVLRSLFTCVRFARACARASSVLCRLAFAAAGRVFVDFPFWFQFACLCLMQSCSGKTWFVSCLVSEVVTSLFLWFVGGFAGRVNLVAPICVFSLIYVS
jgi:hypothetical protein